MWTNELFNLRENIFIDKWNFGNKLVFMDLFIFKGKDFYKTGNFKKVSKYVNT